MRALLNRNGYVWALLLALPLVVGCVRRGEEDFDNRTLEKRPHVETVRPEDRGDAFRP